MIVDERRRPGEGRSHDQTLVSLQQQEACKNLFAVPYDLYIEEGFRHSAAGIDDEGRARSHCLSPTSREFMVMAILDLVVSRFAP